MGKTFPKLKDKYGKDVRLKRGDIIPFNIVIKSNGQPVDISSYQAGGTFRYRMLRSLESFNSPLASGTGTIDDDGTPSNRGKVSGSYDLTGITTAQIKYMENTLMVFQLENASAEKRTMGPLEFEILESGYG